MKKTKVLSVFCFVPLLYRSFLIDFQWGGGVILASKEVLLGCSTILDKTIISDNFEKWCERVEKGVFSFTSKGTLELSILL